MVVRGAGEKRWLSGLGIRVCDYTDRIDLVREAIFRVFDVRGRKKIHEWFRFQYAAVNQ